MHVGIVGVRTVPVVRVGAVSVVGVGAVSVVGVGAVSVMRVWVMCMMGVGAVAVGDVPVWIMSVRSVRVPSSSATATCLKRPLTDLCLFINTVSDNGGKVA